MNRDTIYSSAVLDLDKPAVVMLPQTQGRYMSMQVISQDHYAYAVSKPGRYTIDQAKVGSRYAYLIVRTFIDANSAEDIAAANRLQDALRIEGGGKGKLEIPDWNREQMLTARDALNTLAKLGMSTSHAFGMKDEVDPVEHFVGTAVGWGGLPEKYAFYIMGSLKENDGRPYAVTLKGGPCRCVLVHYRLRCRRLYYRE
jgi:hypothetical protein